MPRSALLGAEQTSVAEGHDHAGGRRADATHSEIHTDQPSREEAQEQSSDGHHPNGNDSKEQLAPRPTSQGVSRVTLISSAFGHSMRVPCERALMPRSAR
jgi:hypothetical protein